MEVFEKLWPGHRQRLTAAHGEHSGKRGKTLEIKAEATAEVVRRYHQRLLAEQPGLVGTVKSPEELAATVQTRVKDLLFEFRGALAAGSHSFNCATHVRRLAFTASPLHCTL